MPYLEVSLMLPATRHRVVRDSGTEHAAYERMIGSLAHRLIAQLCRDDPDPTAIPSLRSIRRLALAAVRPLPFRRGRLAGSFWVPKAVGEDEAKLRHDVRDRLLSLDEFTERVLRWARWYNEERPHGALGRRTPSEVWREAAAPGAVRAEDVVALLRQPTEVRVISKNGVHWRNRDYTHPALNGMADEGIEVQVGPDPDDADALHVYRDRLWLCTARPHAYWKDRMEEFFEARGRVEKHARMIRARASELRSAGVPTQEDRTSEDNEARYEVMLDEALSA
jgi:hypothetical protein